jgi:hypothetical protein
MFERLICGPSQYNVPSAVLSVQRRMRKNIADLTRSFYKDITVIEDHPVCGTKRIGDGSKGTLANSLKLLKLTPSKGREVPGILPHIFYWSHEGVQERASVGLSKVNHREVDMYVKLLLSISHIFC